MSAAIKIGFVHEKWKYQLLATSAERLKDQSLVSLAMFEIED